jgi:hypothetical protein
MVIDKTSLHHAYVGKTYKIRYFSKCIGMKTINKITLHHVQ